LNKDGGKHAKKLQECLCNIQDLYSAIELKLRTKDLEAKDNAENVDNFTDKICDIIVRMKMKEYKGSPQTFKNEAVTEIETYFSKIPGLGGGKARRQASDIFNHLAQEHGEDSIKQNWFNKVVSKIKNMWHGYNPSKLYVDTTHQELANIPYYSKSLEAKIKQRIEEEAKSKNVRNTEEAVQTRNANSVVRPLETPSVQTLGSQGNGGPGRSQ
jgi:hypothetical protein